MTEVPTDTTQDAKPIPAIRTSRGLRDVLFEEIDLLRDGKSSAQRANAIGRLAAGVIDSVKMELDMAKFMRSSEGKAVDGEPPQITVKLGS